MSKRSPAFASDCQALEGVAALETAALPPRRSAPPPWPPASAPAPNGRPPAPPARPRRRRLDREAAAVAIDIEHAARPSPAPPPSPGCRADRRTSRSSARPTDRPGSAPPFSTSSIGSPRSPLAQRSSGSRPSSVRMPPLVAQQHRRRLQHLVERRQQVRQQLFHAGAVDLHHQRVAVAVDHRARQAVRLGMDQPVIGRLEQLSAAAPAPAAAGPPGTPGRPRPAGSRDQRRARRSACAD